VFPSNRKKKGERMSTKTNNENLSDSSERGEVPTFTPPDHSYELTMFENNDSSIQAVSMDREEYIALKEHLAAMRGPQTDTRVGKLEVLQTAETPAAEAVSQVPDWIYETPEPMSYSIAMTEPGGDHLQDIDITRDEYAALKIRVAEMRGLVQVLAAKGE
jgi:hypothetical protein